MRILAVIIFAFCIFIQSNAIGQEIESIIHIETWGAANSGQFHEADEAIYLAISWCDSLRIGNVVFHDLDSTAMIIKMNVIGDTLWTNKIRGKCQIHEITTDSDGNVLVCGENESNAFVVVDSMSSNCDGFIVKFDVNGNAVWLKGFENIHLNCIKSDCEENVYAGGYFSDTAHFANETYVCPNPGFDPANLHALIKLEPNGTELWFRTSFDDNALEVSIPNNYLNDLTIDNECNIWASGDCNTDSTVFNGQLLRYGNMLLKYDSDGHELYSLNYSNFYPNTDLSSPPHGFDVVADQDNIYWVANFTDGFFETALGQINLSGICSNGGDRANVIFHIKNTGELVNYFVVPCTSGFAFNSHIETLDHTVIYTNDYGGSLSLGDFNLESIPLFPRNAYVTQFNNELNPSWVLDTDNHASEATIGFRGIQSNTQYVFLLGRFDKELHFDGWDLEDSGMDGDYFLCSIQHPNTISEKASYQWPLILSPNPTNSYLLIESAAPFTQIDIFDMVGRKVYSDTHFLLKQTTINVERLSPGAYTTMVQTEIGTLCTRFVKE